MTAAATRHHRPGRKATTRTPVRVTAAPPLFRFVRPWWSTGWAAPLWTVPATAAATWAAGQHPTAAPWVAVAALVAVAVLARRPLTRHGLRLAGAVAAVLAAVLAASTAPDVGRGAVLIVATGGALAAWPWLPMRTLAARRARVRTIRAAWPAVVEVTGLPEGTALEDVAPTARGWRLKVRAPRGADAGALAHGARRIGSALGRGEVAVDLDEHDAGRAVVRVTEGADPLTGPARPRPDTAVATVADGAPFAVDENGRPVVLPLVEASGLIGGRPGAGKSVGLSLIAAGSPCSCNKPRDLSSASTHWAIPPAVLMASQRAIRSCSAALRFARSRTFTDASATFTVAAASGEMNTGGCDVTRVSILEVIGGFCEE